MAGTLRSRLGRALLIALTPVLVLGAIGAVSEYNDEASDRRDLLEAAARSGAAQSRVRIDNGVTTLNLLARDSAAADCSARLGAAVTRLAGYETILRLSADGRVLCGATQPRGRAAQPGAWFQQLSAGRRYSVAPADGFADPLRPAVVVATRLEDPAGRFDGVMASIIDVESLRPQIDFEGLPRGAEAALVDVAGKVFASSRADAFSDMSAVSKGPSDQLRVFRAEEGGGARRDHVAAPLLAADLFTVVSAPAPGPFSFVSLNPLVSLGVPLLAFLAAFLAVYMAADRMVIRWLAYLERIAAVYARGRFNIRPQVSADAPAEVHSLANTLAVMADTIAARDSALRDSLSQKDALLREIHHRVKNNLQVITSLLNLQQRALADPAGRAVLADTRQRINALALIYRALYQSDDLRRVEVRSFLEELIGQLVNGEGAREPPVRALVHSDELMLDPDKLAPFALFAVEAVTNAQKHAFPERGGAIDVSFRVVGGEARLEIQDDGVGVDPAAPAGGIGKTLMNAFARQLRGRAELGGSETGGVVARLIFPAPELVVATPAQSRA